MMERNEVDRKLMLKRINGKGFHPLGTPINSNKGYSKAPLGTLNK